jgi:glyoxylase-like metal-dependent hydrolase (beta-lactamase superfamily II)
MSIQVFSAEVTPLAVNSYLAHDDATRDAVLIDPGEFSERIEERIAALRLTVHWILDTHGHFDHIGANAEASRSLAAPIVCHSLDAPMLEDPIRNGSALFGMPTPASKADRLVEDGESLAAGSLTVRVLHTPGHSPGGVCYLIGEDLFSGDTLFAGGIGRYDLPGGDGRALLASIRAKLLVLPPRTRVHPGHGPATTIERELNSNPYLA